MLFPFLELESLVQVNDRTRLDARKSFATPDEKAIKRVEIRPTATAQYIDTGKLWYLDWQYASVGDGTEDATVRITTESGSTATITKTMNLVTEADDNLFSSDADLVSHEPDILKWVREGRNTYKDVHRRCQTLILDWLDQQGYIDIYGAKFTKAAVVDVSEVREWATFMALELIFRGINNRDEDVFFQKAEYYEGRMKDVRTRAVLRLDVDGSGEVSTDEYITPHFVPLVRR